jgi:hypothetical protein
MLTIKSNASSKNFPNMLEVDFPLKFDILKLPKKRSSRVSKFETNFTSITASLPKLQTPTESSLGQSHKILERYRGVCTR